MPEKALCCLSKQSSRPTHTAIKSLIYKFMENIESKNILPEDAEKTAGKENKEGNEYSFTKFNKQKAEEEREKIKKLMEENERLKKESENLST